MVPFSPDRDSVAKDPSKASPGISSTTSKTSGGGSRETAPDDMPRIVASSGEVNTVASAEVDAATKTTPTPVAAVSSGPEPTDIGGGGALSAVQSFCFSDDDDDDDFMAKKAAEAERLSTPFAASTAKGEGSNAGSVRDDGSERGGRSDSSQSDGTNGVGSGGRDRDSLSADGSSDPIQTSSGDGRGQSTERQSTERRRSSGVLPNPSGFDGGEPSDGDRPSPAEGDRLALVRSTPATTGTWSHPDFGFSTDDELNIDLSSSEISSSRQAEGKGEGELTPPPSSSPIQGSYDGFDSSSAAS